MLLLSTSVMISLVATFSEKMGLTTFQSSEIKLKFATLDNEKK